MEKLSSGYRINRAADDAAGLAISEKMRGQIGGLAQAQRNAQDGISLVQTAEGALNEVHSMLQRVRDLKVQFKNGTLSSDDQDAIAAEVFQIAGEVKNISDQTKFNGNSLLGGRPSRSRSAPTTGDDHHDGRRPQRQHRHGRHRRHRRAVGSVRRRGGQGRARLGRRARRAVDDRQRDQERLDGLAPTSARCRTASSTA